MTLTNEEKLHIDRVAFMIIEDNILYLRNSKMSHIQWYESLNLPLDKFKNVIRGYAKKDKIVFYKGDFVYDDEVIAIALKVQETIKRETNCEGAKVFCGVIKGVVGEEWEPKLLLEKN